MIRCALALFALCAVLCCGVADAACYQWQAEANGACEGDLASVGSCYCATYSGTHAGDFSAGGSPSASGQTATFDCLNEDGSVYGFPGNTAVAVAGSCPSSAVCGFDMQYVAGAGTSGDVCLNGCAYNVANSPSRNALITGAPSGGTLSVLQGLNSTCSGSTSGVTPIAPVASGASSEACAAASGTTVCLQTSANGVGTDTLNGTFSVVPGNIASGTCVGTGAGLACAGASPTAPPAPDNGVSSGVPATPVAVVTDNGQTVALYTPAQVSASKGAVLSGTATAVGAGQPCPASGYAASSVCAGAAGTGLGASGVGLASGVCTGSTCDCLAGSICDDMASGGGDCSAAPTCSGDSVLCTAVQQAWLARCPIDTPEGLASAIANDGTPSSVAIGNYGMDLSSALSTASGLPTSDAATCPAPLTVTVAGQSITIDLFSQMCVFAGDISAIILAVAFLISGRIVAGGLLGRTV